MKSLFRNFGVQSKLVALVLATTLVSMLLTGLLGFFVARQLMEDAGYQRLSAFRNARVEAIREHLEQLRDHVLTTSETRITIEGTKEFTKAFSQLPDITDGQKKELRAYYDYEFIPMLKRHTTSEANAVTFYPAGQAERYLKYHYVEQKSRGTRKTNEDAKDGSAWSGVHRQYHSRFARIAELFDYQDMMLVDVKTGNVVYSMAKEEDVGTNLLTGPFRNSTVAKLFRDARDSRDPQFVGFSDFQHYAPSYGKPTMFVGTTIFDGSDFLGVLIFQIDSDRIDNLMTSNRKWKEVGMGSSGETYLVGADKIFRSSPRFFLESTRNYLDTAKKSGLSEAKLDAIRQTGSPVLVQSVATEGVSRALEGRTGTSRYPDYRGVPVVSSYQPIRFGPFNWALLAEIDEDELFQGISYLSRYQLLLAAILIPAATFFSILMAQAFIRPIRRLLDATHKISSGDYRFQIPVSAHDEFGDLAHAFNAMSDRLEEREESLKQQIAENDRLLHSILPSGAASRIKQGAEVIAETHASVSVLYAEIEGWNDLSQTLAFDASMALLKELTKALDDTAQRFELERVQDAGANYLAISGLSHPRIDHQKRAVDCSLAMLQLVNRFNRNHQVDLSLDIGLHSGSMVASVVSRERLSFDIWGQTINIAREIHESPKRNVIQVTEPIQQALQGLYRFTPLPPVSVKGYGSVPIWEVEAAATAQEVSA